MHPSRSVDLLRRLQIAQGDDRLELERLRRMAEHIRTRMEKRHQEIEHLEGRSAQEKAA